MMPNLALHAVLGEQQYERRVVASDDFSNYSDGALQTVSGGKWTNNYSWYGAPSVSGGVLIGGGEDSGSNRYAHSSFLSDQYSKATVAGGAGYTVQFRGVAVRISNDNDAATNDQRDAYWFDIGDGGNQQLEGLRIRKVVNGVVTSLWSRGASPTTIVNPGDTIKLEAIGDLLIAYINDVEVARVNDSSLTGGRPGVTNNGGYSLSAWEGGNIVPITPKVPLLRSRSRSTARAEMPQSSVQLAPEFDTPYAAGFFPSLYGYNNPFGDRRGNWYWEQIKPASASSPRMVEGGMRFYADHGNENDDSLLFSLANIPSGRRDSVGGGRLTTVVVFKAWNQSGSSGSQVVFRHGGHNVSPTSSVVRVGWLGGNGYDYYHDFAANLLDGRWHTVVQSTKHNSTPVVSIDGGGPPTSWTGNLWYVADNSSTVNQAGSMFISSQTGYPDYYHMDGIVRLAVTLPGIYVDQGRAQELAVNPWQIFAPRRRVWVAGTEPAPKPLTVRRQAKRSSEFPVALPSIDWSNPITNGLKFAAYPVGNTFIDLVTGEKGVVSGTTTPAISRRNGSLSGRVEFAPSVEISASSRVMWPVSPTVRGGNMASAPVGATLIALAEKVGPTNGLAYVLSQSEWVTDGKGYVLSIDDYGQSPAYSNILAGAPIGMNAASSAGYSLSDTQDPNDMLHFFGYAVADGGTSGSFFYRGREQTFTAGEFGYGVATNRRAVVGGHASEGTVQPVRVALGLIWDRKLSVAEYRSLYFNIGQLFKRGERKFIFDELAALAQQYPTLSLAELINLLSTQATPRVTVDVP